MSWSPRRRMVLHAHQAATTDLAASIAFIECSGRLSACWQVPSTQRVAHSVEIHSDTKQPCRVHAARSAAQSQPRASANSSAGAAAAGGQQCRPACHQQQSAEELRCSAARSAAGCAGGASGRACAQPGITTLPSAISHQGQEKPLAVYGSRKAPKWRHPGSPATEQCPCTT